MEKAAPHTSNLNCNSERIFETINMLSQTCYDGKNSPSYYCCSAKEDDRMKSKESLRNVSDNSEVLMKVLLPRELRAYSNMFTIPSGGRYRSPAIICCFLPWLRHDTRITYISLKGKPLHPIPSLWRDEDFHSTERN